MADYRTSILMDLFREESFSMMVNFQKDFDHGDMSQEDFESHVYMELIRGIEFSFGLTIPFSDDEYFAAINWMLDLHNIYVSENDIYKAISHARISARSHTNIKFLEDWHTNKLLKARADDVRHRTPGMAFRFGIDKLDEKTGGLYQKEILVLTGPQGSMKTSLVLNGVDNAISRHMQVLFFSLDMSPDILQERRLMKFTGKSQAQIHSELKVKDSEIDKAIDSLILNDDGCLTIYGNTDGVRWNVHTLAEAVRTSRPHVLVIDFLTLLRYGLQDDLKCANEAMPILKEITQECELRTVILSQMGRSSKVDQRAGNFGGHSKGGGIIEELADCEIELMKDSSGNVFEPDKIIATITKNRRGQSGISFNLETEMHSMNFTGNARLMQKQKKGKPIFEDVDDASYPEPHQKTSWFDDED